MTGPARRATGRGVSRGVSRDRHGRGIRSSVTVPPLPRLRTRADLFESTVASTADYLRDLWADDLHDVRVEVADLPSRLGVETDNPTDTAGVERWRVAPSEKRITLFRVPIERFSKLQRSDDVQRQLLVESCVFRAVAEYLGKDPWDLAPERYRSL
ncbi:metallopeptidase family protein [Marisediminicola sp. LYQ134]|uniref:metallopeptidase family protein n=1 Tax=Marisediminicola sp. LYQ134 TaxID=3391061 RepID=UPI003983944D